jgi:hypothetical protein
MQSTYNDNQHYVSPLERYVALKSLREYAYLNKPVTYSLSELGEDIPHFSQYAITAQDLIPSLAILNKDPAARKVQLQEAARKLKTVQHNNALLEALRVGGGLAAASVPISLITHTSIPRNALISALAGASPVAATGILHPSPEAIDQAADILQKHPVSSALPFATVNESIDYGKKESPTVSYLRNMGIGGALGAATFGGLHTIGNVSDYLGNLVVHKNPGMLRPGSNNIFKGVKSRSLLGGALGTGIGALTAYLHNNKNNE